MAETNEIINRILAGEMDAYAEIVRRYQEMLIDYVSFRLPDSDLVREVVHQTFISAYNQLDQFDQSRDLGVWLRVICRYQMLTEIKRFVRESDRKSELRDQIREHLLESALGQEVEEDDSDSGAKEALTRCLRSLKGESRKLVTLRYQQGKSSKQIATQLGRTTTWVTTTLHRVRSSLRKCIEQRMTSGVSS